MKKLIYILFPFFFILLSYYSAFPQYQCESLKLFNNLLPSLNEHEKIKIGFTTYSNSYEKLSNPKSLNDYNFVTRFGFKKHKSFFSHFEFGINVRGFLSFRPSLQSTQYNNGNVTVNVEPASSFGGCVISPGYQVLSIFNIVPDKSTLVMAYAHRYNFFSDQIELHENFKHGNDFSFLLKIKKTAFHTLYRTHVNSYCESFRDTIHNRNYSLPGEFHNMTLLTLSIGDSLYRNAYIKQYVSGYFTKEYDYLNGIKTDSIHINNIIIGLSLICNNLFLNPEFCSNLPQHYDQTKSMIPQKLQSFSIMGGYHLKKFFPMIGFTYTHSFFPTISNNPALPEDQYYYMMNFAIEYNIK